MTNTKKTIVLIAALVSISASALPAYAEGESTDEEPYTIENDIHGRTHGYSYCAEPMELTLACGSSTIPFVPWENMTGTVTGVNGNTETTLMEMAWDPQGPLGEHLRLRVWCSEGSSPEHPCFNEVRGTSPLIIRVDKEHADEHGYAMDQRWSWSVATSHGLLGTHSLLGVDAGASYEQTYTIYKTVFQHEPAPTGYSRLP